MVVRNVNIPSRIQKERDEVREGMSQVREEAENIDVIEKVRNNARKLSGTDHLEKQTERLQAENLGLRSELEQSRFDSLKSELLSRVESLQQGLKGGQSAEGIAQEVAGMVQLMEALGYKRDDPGASLKDLLTVVKEMRSDPTEQLKVYKELKGILGDGQSQQQQAPAPPQLPANVLLEIERIKADTAIRVEEMKNDRQDRQQKFDLEMKRFEFDVKQRQDELASKAQESQQRMEAIVQGAEQVGKSIARAVADSSQAGAPAQRFPVQARQQPRAAAREERQPGVLTADEGESGDFECAVCKTPVQVASDAQQVVCPGCQQPYTVRRTPLSDNGQSDMTSREQRFFHDSEDDELSGARM